MTRGASLDFDGSTDFIDLGVRNLTDGATEITYMCWIATDGLTSGDKVVYCSGSNLNPIFALTRTGADIIFGMNNDALANSLAKVSGVTINTSTWYHFAWTWDAAIATEVLAGSKFYIDGVSQTVVDHAAGTSTTTSVQTTASGSDQIGRRENKTDTWDGQLAHMKIYDRALSNEEVKRVMRQPSSMPGNCVGYWPLWDTTCTDLSGAGNDGTISGTVVRDPSGPPVFFSPAS